MKKLFRLIIIILFCLTVSLSKTSWESDGLKGKVKQKTEIQYLVENQPKEVKKIRYYTSVNKYNIYGNILEEDQYSDEEKLSRKSLYIYDDKGNNIEEERYNEEGKKEGKTFYKYDDKGNEIEGIWYDEKEEINVKIQTQYKGKNKKLEWLVYSPDGSFSRNVNKYDDKGNNIERVQYNKNEKFNLKLSWKYDKKGNKLEESEYDNNGILKGKKLYKYDDKGKLIELTDFNKHGNLKIKTVYTYDRLNMVEEVRYGSYGERISKILYKYDDKGNIREQTSFKIENNESGKDEQIMIFFYEYQYEYYE
jgi:hypothetical protein